MADRSIITPELCRQFLVYDPETGKLFWKNRPRAYFPSDQAHAIWNGRFPGKEAFKAKDRRGYHTGNMLGFQVFSHRAAWAIAHGTWPDQIDHINGDKGDNRLCNMRDVDVRENLRNKSIYKTNRSNYPGIHETPEGRWRVVIAKLNLGTYLTKAEAVAARKAGDICLGYHQNHGRSK